MVLVLKQCCYNVYSFLCTIVFLYTKLQLRWHLIDNNFFQITYVYEIRCWDQLAWGDKSASVNSKSPWLVVELDVLKTFFYQMEHLTPISLRWQTCINKNTRWLGAWTFIQLEFLLTMSNKGLVRSFGLIMINTRGVKWVLEIWILTG